jgi:hypothetical protein
MTIGSASGTLTARTMSVLCPTSRTFRRSRRSPSASFLTRFQTSDPGRTETIRKRLAALQRSAYRPRGGRDRPSRRVVRAIPVDAIGIRRRSCTALASMKPEDVSPGLPKQSKMRGYSQSTAGARKKVCTPRAADSAGRNSHVHRCAPCDWRPEISPAPQRWISALASRNRRSGRQLFRARGTPRELRESCTGNGLPNRVVTGSPKRAGKSRPLRYRCAERVYRRVDPPRKPRGRKFSPLRTSRCARA